MSINKANIGNALHSVAPDHVTAVASDIYDESIGRYQSEINADSGVFDISEYNKSGSPLAPTQYADLAAALGPSGANVPENVRKGGMSVKFINSSTGKYKQCLLMASSWSTTVTDWQGVDETPTVGSKNLVESRGVVEAVNSNCVNVLKDISNVFNINLFDKSSPYNVSGYLDVDGRIFESQNYIVTHYIPFTQQIGKLTLSADGTIGSMYIAYVLYDSSLNVVNGEFENPEQPIEATWEEGVSYIRFTINSAKVDSAKVTIGDNSNKGAYVNFGEISYKYVDGSKIEDGIITTSKLADNSIIAGKILNGSVTTGKIHDGAVTAEKLGIMELVAGKNLLDPTKIVTSKWIKADGTLDNVTSSYGYYDYTEVKPSTQYHISNKDGNALSNRTDCYIAFYNSDKECITTASVKANSTDITTPDNAAYVRISIVVARVTDMDAQMEEGIERTEYQPYVAPSLKIEKQYIQLPDEIQGESIEDGSITQEKLSPDIIVDSKPKKFSQFRVSSNTLATESNLETPLIYVSKNVTIAAEIIGSISSVYVGISYLGYYGKWVEITPTNLVIHQGNNGETTNTYTHGLVLGQKTKIVIDRVVTKDSLSDSTIILIDDYGNQYSTETNWGSVVGKAFVRNNNASGTLTALLSFSMKDLTKDIWLFGDSYFSYNSNARWPYYVIKWGYLNYLLNARGGENATEALADFNTLIATEAVPSYAVWCMGMNNGADNNGQPNSNWLAATQSFLSVCEQKGIVPILATIPSVPTEIHTALNTWVRNSGYRYIDFADQVESSVSGDYLWRGWDTANALLSSDEVHPTAHGACELASRVLIDFPEIAIS